MDIDQPQLTTAMPYFFDSDALSEDLGAVIRSRVLTNRGPAVRTFESAIKDFLAVPDLEVVTCSNATTGLEWTLRCLGLKGKVVVTPFTFAATVHSIVNAGLEPVFADIDPETLCLSPSSVEAVMTPDVSAIVPVHVYGTICDVDGFELLRKRGVKVVYDSAHAFGAKYLGRSAGAFGDAEVFSFHATKTLNACEGGALATHDQELALRFKQAANFGFKNEMEFEYVGTNNKMSELHAVVGLHSLRQLRKAIQVRKVVCDTYRRLFSSVERVRCVPVQLGADPNYQYFPIFLESQDMRDRVYRHLMEESIFTRRYFYPALHRAKPYADMASTSLPHADQAAGTVLCLPLHSGLTASDAERVSHALLRCLH